MKDADAQPWQESEIWDCIVIGGGPAGLSAATYLARFRRKVLVADAGDGRALRIPQINNCPGFPDGISGRELVARLRRQATRYHVRFIDCPVERIERTDEGFTARCETQTFSAKRLLLATGVVDLAPELPEIERNIERRALCLVRSATAMRRSARRSASSAAPIMPCARPFSSGHIRLTYRSW